MSEPTYEVYDSERITTSMLSEAVEIFNESYNIWRTLSECGTEESRVQTTIRELREQLHPVGAMTYYVRVIVDKNPVGYAFACRWICGVEQICWITQLAVKPAHRERGLARGLLRKLRHSTDNIYGIMSPHPAACVAAASSFGESIEHISLAFIDRNLDVVIGSSPIHSIYFATPYGSLFHPLDASGLVCGATYRFFVDREEHNAALRRVRATRNWPLGDLPDGCQYLLMDRTRSI
ncbi:hypothetical protein GGR50DRAFT_694427 [Xylaria sp. CBS 124048]|nr:hypothetical protein GGR50DRAFT_694427 [Xylaria sp. CBS 124048]